MDIYLVNNSSMYMDNLLIYFWFLYSFDLYLYYLFDLFCLTDCDS